MFQNNLLMAAASAAGGGGFSIDYSCRFNLADTTLLTQTLGSAPTDASKGILGGWFKRCDIGILNDLWCAPNEVFHLAFTTEDKLNCNDDAASTLVSTQDFRDPTAWFHIVLSYDSDEGAAADRLKIWYNGVEITSWATDNRSNITSGEAWGMTVDGSEVRIGNAYNNAGIWGGYMAQNLLVDGLSIQNGDYAITDFGELDDNGVWRPVDLTGLTFGNNGWLVDFADSGNLGNDVSGNDNDFASSGFDADDQMTDTPTDNFCTLSSIDKSSNIPLSDGNLVGTFTSSWYNVKATFGVPSSGKWSFQLKGSSAYLFAGVIFGSDDYSDVDTSGTDALYYYGGAGIIATYRTGSYVQQTGLNTPTADENMEILIDKDNDQIGIVIDDVVEMGTDSGLEIQDTMTKFFIQGLNNTLTVDFGQGGYEPSQSGYKALSTANLPTPTILDGTANFQNTLYTGDGSTRNIDQTGNSTFQPDFVWIKNRSQADSHMLIDAARGVTKELNSNSGSTAQITDANGLTSFDSDGFGLGSGAGGYNDNTESFVAWQWLAGGGAGSSNTAGTINTTTTTVNTTAGISISTYAGDGSSGATIGHGLGAIPKMILVKGIIGTDASQQWMVYHEGVATDPATDYLVLNSAAAIADLVGAWNDTAPTSTVFSLGDDGTVNASGSDYVAYCFADVEGFSKFGSYVGNGVVDGPVILTGFKPAWVMIRLVIGGAWCIQDSARSPFNVIDLRLQANLAAAETTSSNNYIDFLSNGFKPRTSAGNTNANGYTHIFMAFAEYPFGGEDVTPATAF